MPNPLSLLKLFSNYSEADLDPEVDIQAISILNGVLNSCLKEDLRWEYRKIRIDHEIDTKSNMLVSPSFSSYYEAEAFQLKLRDKTKMSVFFGQEIFIVQEGRTFCVCLSANRPVFKKLFEKEILNLLLEGEDFFWEFRDTGHIMSKRMTYDHAEKYRDELCKQFEKHSIELKGYEIFVKTATQGNHRLVTFDISVFLPHIFKSLCERQETENIEEELKALPEISAEEMNLATAEAERDCFCAISLEIMRDPVLIDSDQTFENKSIQEWLKTKDSCPLTRLPVSKTVVPNIKIKDLCDEYWKKLNNYNRRKYLLEKLEDSKENSEENHIRTPKLRR